MITVTRVSIPAMSTIGYGFGTDEAGNEVEFVGDHRPMRAIGDAITAASSPDELPMVDDDDNEVFILRITKPTRQEGQS